MSMIHRADCGRRSRRSAVGQAPGAVLLAVLALGLPRLASAQMGVSDDRVSLPDGPGSLEGVGENVSIDSNMGLMRHSVPIEVPEGHPGITPALALTYSSGNGGSVAGMGWSLDLPFIERMTARGLPRYDTSDGFTVGGGEELVRVPGTSPPIYRARFEGSFVRYTWMGAGTADDYFVAEYPDGRRGYFGATAGGTPEPDARVSGAQGTFRYHLVDLTDRFGHTAHYTYGLFGNYTLIQHIGWAFVGDAPTYEATFTYEARTDLLSDCKAGFEELLDQRLTRINVLARGTRIRYYDLAYQAYADSGGFSRLASVHMVGLGDVPFPVHETFAYSQSLGGLCDPATSCIEPFLTSMGSLGAAPTTGTVTLLDLNGDSLPDVVETPPDGGYHHLSWNTLAADGTHSFVSGSSTVGLSTAYSLANAWVQAFDADGDGFTDLVNAFTGDMLHNRGTGDWVGTVSLWSGISGLPSFTSGYVRFLDYDNDKRIDIVYAYGTGTSNVTQIYSRDAATGLYQADPAVEPIGWGFDNPKLELNDMNGDGLLDPVLVTTSGIQYRLNLGWGRWTEVRTAALPGLGTPLTEQEMITSELEDINGDGLADLVLVAGGAVRYWLNRNGASFDPEVSITGMPATGPGTVVLFADMNGSGSSDVVWIIGATGGEVQYLELFAVRPNLLSRIENGLGKVTDVTYGTSVEERVRDATLAPWSYPLPHPMTVVTQLDDLDTLTGVHQITSYQYHDGYYDGDEKQFRGYAGNLQHEPGTASSEEATALETWDVGHGDPYRRSLLLTREVQGAGGRSLQHETHEYADCAVTGAEATAPLERPVRHVCPIRVTTQLREGLPDGAQWLTTQVRYEHDGHGNLTLESDLGVIDGCPASCAAGGSGTPCGTGCLGDEHHASHEYVVPSSGAWIVDRPSRRLTYGAAAASGGPASTLYTEEIYHYDGPDFVGLDDDLTAGALTRLERRRAAGDATFIQAERNRLDAHGNVVERIDPIPTGTDGDVHRRVWTYDATGLRVVRTELLLQDEIGPYRLRKDYDYDELWDRPREVTSWMLVRGGATDELPRSTHFTYDAFGRVASTVLPGGSLAAPTEQYTYELGSPSSRILIRQRSQHGGALDLERVTCHDGHGREYQRRTRVADGEYLVSGFTIFDGRGHEQEVYQVYTSTSGACDLAPAAGTLSMRRESDALGRPVRELWPDADPGAPEAAETRTEYLPLAQVFHDLEDTRPGGPHAGTPTTTRLNGLGQRVAVALQSAPGVGIETRFLYDELGRPAGWVDGEGNRHGEERDLLGNVVRVEDPDRGVTTFEYDAASNLVRRTDARGVVAGFSYDGSNRLAGTWDAADDAGTRVSFRYDTPGTCPADHCTNVSGRLASASYPLDGGRRGEDRHGYDAQGNVVRLERRIGERVLTFESAYDTAGHATRNSFPSGLQFDLLLDGVGRVKAVDGYLDEVAYDARGQIARVVAANGVVTERTYDGRLRTAAITATAGDGTAVLDYGYLRDRIGNITEILDGRADDGQPMAGARFTYDALYRLTLAELDPDRTAHAEQIAVAHDALGRITSMESSRGADSPAHVGDYAYGGGAAGPHALTSAGGVTMTYDAGGHLTARGEDGYGWDWLGRMANASRGGSETASFVYAGNGQRLIKRELGGTTYYLAADFEVEDGVASAYLRLDDARVVRVDDPTFAPRILSDVAPASGTDAALVPSPDDLITAADGWLALAAGDGTLAFAATTEVSDPGELLMASVARMLAGTQQTVGYLHQDHLGGTTAVTDGTGALVGRVEYYPYGSPRYQSGGADRHGFTGLEADEGTGLVHAGARELDPWTGRFVSADPAFATLDPGLLQAVRADDISDAYAYGQGNPTGYVDEAGTWPLWEFFKSLLGSSRSTAHGGGASSAGVASQTSGAASSAHVTAAAAAHATGGTHTTVASRVTSAAAAYTMAMSGGVPRGTFFSPQSYGSAAQARAQSALPAANPAHAQVTGTVPTAHLTAQTRVAPLGNQPGGGLEMRATQETKLSGGQVTLYRTASALKLPKPGKAAAARRQSVSIKLHH